MINPKDKKIFLISSVLLVCYFIPILIHNIYYIDDYARAAQGYAAWKSTGRPVTEYGMRLLNFSFLPNRKVELSDTFPLPHLLSILAFSVTAALYLRRLFTNYFEYQAIGFSFVILNPFFLQNISYRYDVLSMVLAVCLAVLSSVALCRSRWLSLATGILLLTLALNTYQASLNTYLMCVLFNALFAIHAHKRTSAIFGGILRGITVLIVSLLLYSATGYAMVSQYEGMHIAPLGELYAWVLSNSRTFYTMYSEVFTFSFTVLVVPLAVVAYGSLVLRSCYYVREKAGVGLFVLALCSPLLALLCLPGIFLVYADAEIHYRTAMSFGVLLFGMTALFIAAIPDKLKWLRLWPALIVLMTFDIGYSWFNALHAQDQLIRRTLVQIAELSSPAPEHNEIVLGGRLDTAPEAQTVLYKYPYFRHLLPHLDYDSRWQVEKMNKWLGFHRNLHEYDQRKHRQQACAPGISVRSYDQFDAYRLKKGWLIDFNKRICEHQ